MAVVRDLKTDSLITTRLPLPDNLKIQDSATADELNIQRLLSVDLHSKIHLFILLLYAQKDDVDPAPLGPDKMMISQNSI